MTVTPFVNGRIIDASYHAARVLDFVKNRCERLSGSISRRPRRESFESSLNARLQRYQPR